MHLQRWRILLSLSVHMRFSLRNSLNKLEEKLEREKKRLDSNDDHFNYQ